MSNQDKIRIYDCFTTNNDEKYFLVDYLDNDPFWASENQLSRSKVDHFTSNPNLYLSRCFWDSKKNTVIEPCDRKSKTDGIFLGCYNCNVIASFREIYNSENIAQAVTFCLDTFQYMINTPNYVVYDLGCKLKKYIENENNILNETERLKALKMKNIVVDRFHFEKHSITDQICRNFCDANKYSDLNEVNTSVCEEINFWFSKYKHIIKHMNRTKQYFYLYNILDEFNYSQLLLKLKK